MRAHVMDGVLIANTIEVESLDFMPGLIDASIGGGPGDSIVDGVLVPAAILPPTSAEIQSRIDSMERDSLENRGAREFHLRAMEQAAVTYAAAHPPVTVDQVLAQSPYYTKLKALDVQIAELRAQL